MYCVRVFEKGKEVTEYMCIDQKHMYMALIFVGYNHCELIDNSTLGVKCVYLTDMNHEINLLDIR